MKKIVCQLDEQGYFIGPVIADPSPLETDVFLIPAGAVDAEPPVVSGGFRARWENGQFISEAIELPPLPPEPTLAEMKAWKNDEINAARAQANTSVFSHDGKSFACDALSRSDIDGVNGYVALYGELPPAFPGAWKAVDNSYYPIADLPAWKAFYTSMVATGTANFMHAQQLKAQLEAATSPAEVADIEW